MEQAPVALGRVGGSPLEGSLGKGLARHHSRVLFGDSTWTARQASDDMRVAEPARAAPVPGRLSKRLAATEAGSFALLVGLLDFPPVVNSSLSSIQMRILVTGSAGFIGFHVARRLLALGHEVTGLDGVTPYYDRALKLRRHAILAESPGFSGHEILLEDTRKLAAVYGTGFDQVYHFAAQAGVRYSLENPRSYIDANIVGTYNLLELMRAAPPRHALIASTSSVYGANARIPFREIDPADHPLTLYAASKKATEEMAHAYSHLFGIPVTMLRFFTVYGPWGRPDMALFKFAAALYEGRPIDIYNHGKMRRDFTYVGDLAEAIVLLAGKVPPPPDADRTALPDIDSLSPVAPWRVVNIGAEKPVDLMEFVATVEAATGLAATCNFMDMQQGDVPATFADTTLLSGLTGFKPTTPLAEGVAAFVAWYRDYYRA